MRLRIIKKRKKLKERIRLLRRSSSRASDARLKLIASETSQNICSNDLCVSLKKFKTDAWKNLLLRITRHAPAADYIQHTRTKQTAHFHLILINEKLQRHVRHEREFLWLYHVCCRATYTLNATTEELIYIIYGRVQQIVDDVN